MNPIESIESSKFFIATKLNPLSNPHPSSVVKIGELESNVKSIHVFCPLPLNRCVEN